MSTITLGRLLDGSPAQISLTDVEAAEFRRSSTYAGRLFVARGAGLRSKMISMLLTADGRLESNVVAREPGPGEELVWLRAGQFYDTLDSRPPVTLGPGAVAMLGPPGGRTRGGMDEAELIAQLDSDTPHTAQEIADELGADRSAVQKALVNLEVKGLARRDPPGPGHRGDWWYASGPDPDQP